MIASLGRRAFPDLAGAEANGSRKAPTVRAKPDGPSSDARVPAVTACAAGRVLPARRNPSLAWLRAPASSARPDRAALARCSLPCCQPASPEDPTLRTPSGTWRSSLIAVRILRLLARAALASASTWRPRSRSSASAAARRSSCVASESMLLPFRPSWPRWPRGQRGQGELSIHEVYPLVASQNGRTPEKAPSLPSPSAPEPVASSAPGASP